jgi:V-type H+-transporting ATPase subunit E
VTVIVRKKDEAIAQRAAQSAAKSYFDISGRQTEISVDASLPDEGYVFPLFSISVLLKGDRRAGGVKLINGTRRITLDNTLDERLRLLEDRVRISTSFYPASGLANSQFFLGVCVDAS